MLEASEVSEVVSVRNQNLARLKDKRRELMDQIQKLNHQIEGLDLAVAIIEGKPMHRHA